MKYHTLHFRCPNEGVELLSYRRYDGSNGQGEFVAKYLYALEFEEDIPKGLKLGQEICGIRLCKDTELIESGKVLPKHKWEGLGRLRVQIPTCNCDRLKIVVNTRANKCSYILCERISPQRWSLTIKIPVGLGIPVLVHRNWRYFLPPE